MRFLGNFSLGNKRLLWKCILVKKTVRHTWVDITILLLEISLYEATLSIKELPKVVFFLRQTLISKVSYYIVL